jgi:hypothetical protein
VRLDDEELSALEQLREQARMTASEFVRVLIRQAAGIGPVRIVPQQERHAPRVRKAGTRAPIEEYELVRVDSAGNSTWTLHLPCGHSTIRPCGREVTEDAPNAREIIPGRFFINVPEALGCDDCKAGTYSPPVIHDSPVAEAGDDDPPDPELAALDVEWRRNQLIEKGYTEEQIERVLADDARSREYKPNEDPDNVEAARAAGSPRAPAVSPRSRPQTKPRLPMTAERAIAELRERARTGRKPKIEEG